MLYNTAATQDVSFNNFLKKTIRSGQHNSFSVPFKQPITKMLSNWKKLNYRYSKERKLTSGDLSCRTYIAFNKTLLQAVNKFYDTQNNKP